MYQIHRQPFCMCVLRTAGRGLSSFWMGSIGWMQWLYPVYGGLYDNHCTDTMDDTSIQYSGIPDHMTERGITHVTHDQVQVSSYVCTLDMSNTAQTAPNTRINSTKPPIYEHIQHKQLIPARPGHANTKSFRHKEQRKHPK
jgi:hypothetical protein